MSKLSKRSTIYFEPEIHRALKMRAASSNCSVSELVDEAVRLLMREDREDLEAFSERADEPEISYEELLEDLKQHGKIYSICSISLGIEIVATFYNSYSSISSY